jgi:SulP family sulfate permease
MATTAAAKAAPKFPILEGIRPVDRKRVPTEVIAGITLACLAIPEVMGYANIAGMPPITGLYTLVLPVIIFALLGSSRHLVVGADSATAAIIFAGLSGMAAVASPQWVALAGMLALITGGYLLLARVLKLGFIANFLSRTVLIGFLTGVGIQVACGQFPGLFGLAKSGRGPVEQVYNAFADMGSASWTTFAVSVCVIAIIVVGDRLAHRVPWALIAVIGAIVASKVLDLSAHGVSTLGTVPSGLPSLTWPSIDSGDYGALFALAASIFVVILAQSAATSRAYAAKFNDGFEENIDLVGLGIANFSAGFTGTFVVNGSPTKTAMVDHAGGRSQLAQLTTAAVVIIVLLFLTKPLSYMPSAVLAAVVFLIGVELVDIKGMRTILARRPVEFWVALITAAAVIFVGVEQGVILAIVLSILIHLRHSYRPLDVLLAPAPGGSWKIAPRMDRTELAPGLMVYAFGASLFYANSDRFSQEILDLVDGADPPLEWFCIVADAVDDIDFTGSLTLRAVHDELQKRGVTLALCHVLGPVQAELDRDGVTELIGKDHIFEHIGEVSAAYAAQKAQTPRSSEPAPDAG